MSSTPLSPSVPNSPQELLDMNISSWEDSVCSQLTQHHPLEVYSMLVRCIHLLQNYYHNTQSVDNYQYNLLTSGELGVIYHTLTRLLSETEERVSQGVM